MRRKPSFAAAVVVASVFGLTCFAAYGQAGAESTVQIIKQQAPKGITTTFYSCTEKAGSDHIAQSACLSAEKKAQNDRLNSVYKIVLGKLNKDDKESLVSAERTWLELHKKSEEFEESLYGSDPVASSSVALNEIFRICERANTLDNYAYIAGIR